MKLRTWAAKWHIPMEALLDLEHHLGTGPLSMDYQTSGEHHKPGSEARQQDLVTLEAPRKGVRLFRNNSGALKDKDGRLVRFGLGNTSAAVNEVLKSPDLIGWRPTLIRDHMVGSLVAQTVLREMKPEDWQFSGTEHERAQLAFMELAIADGADACFCTGPGTL